MSLIKTDTEVGAERAVHMSLMSEFIRDCYREQI